MSTRADMIFQVPHGWVKVTGEKGFKRWASHKAAKNGKNSRHDEEEKNISQGKKQAFLGGPGERKAYASRRAAKAQRTAGTRVREARCRVNQEQAGC